ncbi:MAG TPA: hypothetical protein VN814_00315 [Caulobacteraceae bacterium]|nr:hypothetical protein [Caulobacteraceae bacterium]
MDRIRQASAVGAVAAVTLALGGSASDAAAAAPAMDKHGFPQGYACYHSEDQDNYTCYPHVQTVPRGDRCYPAGGGKLVCYPASSRVTAKTKLPPIPITCYKEDASVSYICSAIPEPAPPPPPPPPGVMPN